MPKGKGKKHQRESKKTDKKHTRYTNHDPEYRSLSAQLFTQGMKLKDVPGDGNCLFRALADQLDDTRVTHRSLRTDIAEFMRTNVQDFKPFMEEEGISYEEYIAELMRDGVYGGNDSIVAFARFYDCTVVIHQPNSPQWEVQGCMNPTQAIKRRRFHIAYLNGEHYCSVVPIDDHPLTESSAASDIGSSTHHTTDEVFMKTKQTTPYHTHNGTNEMHGMCEETSVVDTVMGLSGCMDRELTESVLRDNSYDSDMAIVELLQIMDLSGKDSSSLKVTSPSIKTKSIEHSTIDVQVTNKTRKNNEKHQTHVSNRKRKEIAKKERKERKLKQRQTDKKDNIESVDDPMNSLLI